MLLLDFLCLENRFIQITGFLLCFKLFAEIISIIKE